MNVLLLGSGGREHAFAWKLTQSPLLTKLFIAPGNAGTALHGENIEMSATDFPAIKKFVLANQIEMVVVGPEDPLVKGVHDFFMVDHPDTGMVGIKPVGNLRAAGDNIDVPSPGCVALERAKTVFEQLEIIACAARVGVLLRLRIFRALLDEARKCVINPSIDDIERLLTHSTQPQKRQS